METNLESIKVEQLELKTQMKLKRNTMDEENRILKDKLSTMEIQIE